jgi:hydroxymethylglutaryl-CoA lyase
VRPSAIPQLSDAEAVMAGIERRRPGVTYLCLVPNLRGYRRARAAHVDAIAVFTAASETFAKRNINMSDRRIAGRVSRRRASGAPRGRLGARLHLDGLRLPLRGRDPARGRRARGERAGRHGRRRDLDRRHDRRGRARTGRRGRGSVAEQVMPVERLAMHFHDTRGTALANVRAALQMNVATFDSSSGGLGGCPYAPGATGNLATESLLAMLHGMGIETGVDLEAVRAASRFIGGVLGREPAPA